MTKTLLLSIFVNYYIMRDKERQETVKTHSVSIVYAGYNQLAFENGLHHRIPPVILSRMVSSSCDEDTVVIYLCQLLVCLSPYCVVGYINYSSIGQRTV